MFQAFHGGSIKSICEFVFQKGGEKNLKNDVTLLSCRVKNMATIA